MADLTVTAANVLRSSGRTETGTAGGTVTQGMAVYFKTSDRKWYGAQHDGTAAESGSGTGNKVGIALTGGSAGQPITVQLDGVVNLGATLTVGTAYYVGAAAGGICAVADLLSTEYVTFLGIATTAALLKLAPCASGVQVP